MHKATILYKAIRLNVRALISWIGLIGLILVGGCADPINSSSVQDTGVPALDLGRLNLGLDLGRVAPIWPTDALMQLVEVGETKVTVSWTSVSDDVSVVGYTLYQDLIAVKDLAPDVQQATIDNLEPNREYLLSIEAIDADGHRAEGPSLEIHTVDVTAPTFPSEAELTASEISSTELSLQWREAIDNDTVDHYVVSRAGADDLIVEGTSAQIEGLTPWTNYTFSVEAIDPSGNISTENPTLNIQTPDGGPPKWSADGLQVTASGPNSISVRWEAAHDDVLISEYQVLLDGVIHTTVNGDTFEADISGLSAWTWYTVELGAVDPADNLSLTDSVRVRTADIVPPEWPADAVVNVEDLTAVSLTLSWPAVIDDVAVSTILVEQDDVLITSLAGDATRWSVTGLFPWTDYHFSIRAMDNAGHSTESLSVDVRTLDTQAPSWSQAPNLIAENLTADSLSLQWSRATDDVSVIYEVSQDDLVIQQLSGDQNTLDVTDLSPWTSYRFAVVAIDPAGNRTAEPATLSVRTLDQVLPRWGPDAALTATVITPNSVELQWTAATDDVSLIYSIYQDGAFIDSTPEGVQTIVVQDLSPWTSYHFEVHAEDPAGNTSLSPLQLTTRTSDITAPSWPATATLTASNIQPDQLTLDWPRANDDVAVHYLVKQDDRLLATLLEGTESLIVQGLNPWTQYDFSVSAIDNAGQRATPDLTLQVRTIDDQVPSWAIDAQLEVEAVSADRITVRWPDAVDDVEVSYRVYLNGNLMNTVDATTTRMVFTDLQPWTNYQVEIIAADPAGNIATQTLSVDVRTLDEVAPFWPESATLIDVDPIEYLVTLQWPAALDDAAITGYRLSVNGNVHEVLAADSQSYVVDGLVPGQRYHFAIEAFDDATNVSPPITLEMTLGLAPCTNPLQVTANTTTVAAQGLVQFEVTGGTEHYTAELLQTPSGGEISQRPFVYIAGEVTGGIDVIRFQDIGCSDTIDISIEVLSLLTLTPQAVNLPRGACTTFQTEGGSGQYTYTIISANPIGSIDQTGLYNAGQDEGVELIRVTDQITNIQLEAWIQVVSDAEFAFSTPQQFIPLGSDLKPSFDVGTTQYQLTSDSTAVTVSLDGRQLIANEQGTATVTATDPSIGCLGPNADQPARASTRITVLPALSVPMDGHFIGSLHLQQILGPLDLNGDGFLDVIISDAGANVGGLHSGTFNIFRGTPDGLNPEPDLIVAGQETSGRFTTALTIGEFTGDGVDDLVVGAPGEVFSGVGEGTAYLYEGIANGFFNDEPSRSFSGLTGTFNEFATALATCDFDGDGFDDLAISSPESISQVPYLFGRGMITVYYGEATGLAVLPRQRIWGLVPKNGSWIGVTQLFFGQNMAAGDFDGDGACELAVQAFGHGNSRGARDVNRNPYDADYFGGTVMLLDGRPGVGLTETPSRHYTQLQEDPGYGDRNGLGQTMTFRDLDGDNKAELVLSNAIVRGQPLPTEPELTPTSITQADWLSGAARPLPFTLADINLDGQSDLIIGDRGVKVYLGDPNTLIANEFDPSLSFRTSGNGGAHGNLSNLAADFGGHIESDNLGSAIVTIPSQDPQLRPRLIISNSRGPRYQLGAHYEVEYVDVQPSGPTLSVVDLDFPILTAGSRIGSAVLVEDLTGDGTDDLVIGAPNGWAGDNGSVLSPNEVSNERQGAAYVYIMDDGFPTEPTTILDDFTNYWQPFGAAISSAGDFDNDGITDLAILNPMADIYRRQRAGHYWPYIRCAAGDAVWQSGVWVCPDGADPAPWGGTITSLFSSPTECDQRVDQAGWIHVYRGTSAEEWAYAGENHGGRRPSFVLTSPYARTRGGVTARINGEVENTPLTGGFDLNGDNHDDLAWGIPHAGEHVFQGVRYQRGGVMIYLGRQPADPRLTEVSCTPDLTLTGPDRGMLGFSVTPVSDLDADGCDEVAISAPGAIAWDGLVYVLLGYGANCARPPPEVLTVDARSTTAAFGWALAGGKDIDGDGLGDLVVSAPYAYSNRNRRGAVLMVSGLTLRDAIQAGQTTPIADGDALPDDSVAVDVNFRYDSPHSVWGEEGDVIVRQAPEFSAPGTPHAVSIDRFGAALTFVEGVGEHGVGLAISSMRKNIGLSLDAGEVRVYAWNDTPIDGRHLDSQVVMVGQTWRGDTDFGTNLASGVINGKRTLVVGVPGASPPEVEGEIDNGAVYLVPLD